MSGHWVSRPLAQCDKLNTIRNGTQNLFIIGEPFADWRHVEVTKRRYKQESVQQMQTLVDDHYSDTDCIWVVLDYLDTHKSSTFYEFLPPEKARRFLGKLEFHFTPRHGNWLNVAQIEFSALGTECFARRIPDAATLHTEVTVRERIRNEDDSAFDWQFTTEDAHIKLRRLYPTNHT